MTDDTLFDAINESIGEVATDIAQSYAEFGDLTSMYLGQTSSTLQLRLFRPLALEVSLYMGYLLDDFGSPFAAQILQETEEYAVEMEKAANVFVTNRLDTYRKAKDHFALFAQICQEVVSSDALWLSTQKKDTQPQKSISDKGYVAIQKGAFRLNQLVELL